MTKMLIKMKIRKEIEMIGRNLLKVRSKKKGAEKTFWG